MTDDDHNDDSRIEELLPWYVNGTLDDLQRAEVERWLSSNPRAREELALLEAVRDTISRDRPDTSPELGWRRLQRRLHGESPGRSEETAGVARWWRPLAIAASLVLALQTVLFLTKPGDDGLYRPLSGETTAQQELQITFHPDATEAQIRELLMLIGAELVAGPGALGIYRIRIDDDSVSMASIRERLESSSIIDSVSWP